MSEDIQNSEAAPVEDSGTASVPALLSGSLDEGNGTAAGAGEQIEAALLELASHARTDVVAERWVGRDGSGYKPGSGAISQAAIRAHLSHRGPHLGLYVMPPGDTTRLAAFDLDDHDGTTGWEVIAATAMKIGVCLDALACRPLFFRSGGGKGIHIFLLWKEPQPAKAVRSLMTSMLASFNLRDGDGGVGKNEVEVFPKQNSVKQGGYGALIALPLARQSVALSPASLAEAQSWRIQHCRPVSAMESMWKVREALSFLPSDDHEQWIAFGHALQHEFGDDGFPLWDEWSARSEKYDGPIKSRHKWDRDLRASGNITIRSVFSAAEDAGWNGRPPKGKAGDRKSQTDVMVEMVGACELWHSETSAGFITIRDGGPPRNLPINHADFKGWLTIQLRKTNGKAPNNAALEETVRELNAVARFERPQHQTWLRVGQDEGRDKLYLDLGRADWKVIEIDAEGWRLIDESPVKFRRANGRELPMPVPGGNIDELRQFLNLGDEEFMLVVCWLLKCFLPGAAFPILWLAGEQGTAKTTALKVCRMLIDPAKAMVRSMARTEENLLVAALNNWVVSADNLSHVDDDMADALCRLATQGGLSKRTQYTDGEEFTIDAMRPQLYSGINLGSNRPDWLNRLIYVKLQPIPEGKRMTERRFWSAFEDKRGRILGVLLDGVATAIARLPEVEERAEAGSLTLPRLSDFGAWIAAAAPAFGWTEEMVLDAFTTMQRSMETSAAEGDSSVRAIRDFVLSLPGGRFEGRATPLHEGVEAFNSDIRSDRFWPRNASALGRKMDRIAPLLRALGFTVNSRPDSEHTMVYTIVAPATEIDDSPETAVAATVAELARQRDELDRKMRALLNGGASAF